MARNTSTKGRKKTSRQRQGKKKGVMVFSRKNYVLLVVGLAMILVGYVIMRWDNQVDGFLSLYVAPLILLAGYLEIIYAIMWRPKADTTVSEA